MYRVKPIQRIVQSSLHRPNAFTATWMRPASNGPRDFVDKAKDTVKDMDEKLNVSENLKSMKDMAEDKAKELDEKYDLSGKAAGLKDSAETIRERVESLSDTTSGSAIKEAFVNIKDKVIEKAKDATETIVHKVEDALHIKHDAPFTEKMMGAAVAAKETAETVTEKVKNVMDKTGVTAKAKDTAEYYGDILSEKAAQFGDKVKSTIPGAETAADMLSSAKDTVKSMGEKVMNTDKSEAMDAAKNAGEQVMEKASEVGTRIKSAASSTMDTMSDVSNRVGGAYDDIKHKVDDMATRTQAVAGRAAEKMEKTVGKMDITGTDGVADKVAGAMGRAGEKLDEVIGTGLKENEIPVSGTHRFRDLGSGASFDPYIQTVTPDGTRPIYGASEFHQAPASAAESATFTRLQQQSLDDMSEDWNRIVAAESGKEMNDEFASPLHETKERSFLKNNKPVKTQVRTNVSDKAGAAHPRGHRGRPSKTLGDLSRGEELNRATLSDTEDSLEELRAKGVEEETIRDAIKEAPTDIEYESRKIKDDLVQPSRGVRRE